MNDNDRFQNCQFRGESEERGKAKKLQFWVDGFLITNVNRNIGSEHNIKSFRADFSGSFYLTHLQKLIFHKSNSLEFI